MSELVLLRVIGEVDRPLALTFGDLSTLPDEDQVNDVSRFQPARTGDGVTLESVLRLCQPRPEANYLTLHAERDDFHVSIPLDATRAEGIIVYRLGGEPLPVERGGPIRYLIRNPAACHTSELDECANVKHLDSIELSTKRGRDTRPVDEAQHMALHSAGLGPERDNC